VTNQKLQVFLVKAVVVVLVTTCNVSVLLAMFPKKKELRVAVHFTQERLQKLGRCMM
jgi:hypothetical protein